MKYTVLWSKKAETNLAALWLAASNQKSLTEAANSIDQILAADPHNAGESRPDGVRILFVAPLGVLFRVNEGDRKVIVLAVWQFKTRSK